MSYYSNNRDDHSVDEEDQALIAGITSDVLPHVSEGSYREFLVDVCRKGRLWGHLSQNQRVALSKAVVRQEQRVIRPAIETAPSEGLLKIQALMKHAAQHRQFPRIEAEGFTFTVAGRRSNLPGAVNVKQGDEYVGRIDSGAFYVGNTERSRHLGALALAERIGEDPAAVLGQMGRETGECCFCSRPLTDARSVKAGYGPTCADDYGLPW